ncbi:MFS general substrate transporter [Parathielavia appendiculata]|uniref:MFS general substrate transporter n=1 Tax=Parathielavia appendiculata TaxID=2587402 RepID=A0AAN6U851_9PEZI|nr:MFS general substrate transporter [Parathielavia appendiculata]
MEKTKPCKEAEKACPASLSTSSTSRNEIVLPLTDIDQHQPSTAAPDEALTIVSFEPNDPANPHNCTTFFSTLPSNFSPPLPVSFHVPDPTGPQRVLPASLFLAGFVFGPLLWAPLSESPLVGRWRVLATGAALFVLFSVGQAVVQDWAAFLALRFLAGMAGSPPISVFGGVIADLYDGEVGRGRVIMIWSAMCFIGPLGAPIMSGFLSPKLGWRAVFWRLLLTFPPSRIALSLPVTSLLGVLLMPETLASAILRRKAVKLNKGNLDIGKRFVAETELKQESAWDAYKTTLSRPWRLLLGEMVVSLSCAYMGFVYAVFYMLIQIFPRVFQGVYGFSPGMSGILFTITGLGTLIGCFIFFWYDGFAPRLSVKHPTKREEYLRLPLVCTGGPLFVVSMLWLGWSARPDIHWLVPLSSTISYGLASHLIYVGIINYVTDAYGVYSASALAAMSMTRSAAGAVLPLAIEDMVDALGIAWSCTVLAGVSAGLALVPFGFIAYGERIRAASRFSAALKPGTRVENMNHRK